MSTLSNVETRRGEAIPPRVRLTPDDIPEAKSTQKGVSVRYVPALNKNWYVFRASYGREDKAMEYIVEDGTYAYIPKRYVKQPTTGQTKRVLENLIPNLLFVYTTKEKAEEYIKATPDLSYLTYYYNHFAQIEDGKNPPLTIACQEMENFIRATYSHNEHLRLIHEEQCHYKFKGGEKVIITDGPFTGVEGKVARVLGQQRIVVSLSGIGLVSTAYIPTAFIKAII